jgi:hypothetical protein
VKLGLLDVFKGKDVDKEALEAHIDGLIAEVAEYSKPARQSAQPALYSVGEAEIAELRAAGVPDRVVEAMESLLSDAASDIERLSEVVDDLQWQNLTLQSHNSSGVRDLSPESRRRRNNAAERATREDVNVGRAVELINDYVWGRGMVKPAANDPRVQRIVDSAWEDPENQLILFSYEAQKRKGTDWQQFSEIFLVAFDNGRWGDLGISVTPRQPGGAVTDNPDGADIDSEDVLPNISDLSGGKFDVKISGPLPDSAVKLGHIHPNEIVDVIPDEENNSRPRYYKRVTSNYRYDYQQGRYVIDQRRPQITRYYQSLYYPPQEGQPAAPESLIGTGRIIHMAKNVNSFGHRGNSEVWRTVKWAEALTDSFTWHLTLMRALATYPFKKKVKGGTSAVLQAAMRPGSALTPGATGAVGGRDMVAAPRVGSVLTENMNENLEQMKVSTGAAEFANDVKSLRSQLSAGTGLPPHYLGDEGSANLANATSMELPVLKHIEGIQESFKNLIRHFLDYCVQKAIDEGVLPEDVDRTINVRLPNILMRNIPELTNALVSVSARLDPFAIDYKLKRFVMAKFLEYIGEPEPMEIVQQLYPFGAEKEAAAQAAQMAALVSSGGAVPPGGTSVTPTPGAAGTTNGGPPRANPSDPSTNKKKMAQTPEAVAAKESELQSAIGDVNIDDLSEDYRAALAMLLDAVEEIGVQDLKRFVGTNGAGLSE